MADSAEYVCEACGRRFEDEQALEAHMREAGLAS